MIGTLDIKVAAHNPNFPLEPVFTFINSAQSFRIRNVPRAIGKWNITKVFIHLNYPDNTTVQKECVLNGNIWIGTVEGCATSGTSTNGFYVTASGIDENENVITNYVLGAGDLYVKDLDGTIDPERVGTKMYFNDTLPTNPKKGDATFIDQTLNVYDGANWVPVAVSPDPSFIIDADGNKICADRTVEIVEQGEQSWTLTDGTNTYTLTGTRLNSIWETESERYTLIGGEDEEHNIGAWTLKYQTPPLPGMSVWITKWTEFYNGTFGEQSLPFPTHGFTATWNDGKQITQDELALKSDLPTKTSDLTNDSGFITSSDVPTKTSDLTNDSDFITSAEIAPYHGALTPNVNTGLAKQAMTIALQDGSYNLKPNSTLGGIVETNLDLTDEFTAVMGYATYYPYNLEKYFEQTFSPALELKFCEGKLAYLMGNRPRTFYTGYMFRTGGAGFAMPCSEDGTPDGRLYETTEVRNTAVIVADQTTSLHQLTFTTRYNDPYGQVATIDGQSGQMTCWRTNAFKMYSISEELANKSDLPTKTSDLTNDSGFITSADVPTKTSDLTNDSGFITSADIITKRDLNDLNIYVDPMAEHTPIEVTVWHTDEISTLYTLNWNGSSWYYTDGSTSIQIYFDDYSNDYILDGSIQNMGGTIISVSKSFNLTSPLWNANIETPYFFKIEVVSVKAHIATKEYVDSRFAALEARIVALENNNQ